jgi:hypothetical protein
MRVQIIDLTGDPSVAAVVDKMALACRMVGQLVAADYDLAVPEVQHIAGGAKPEAGFAPIYICNRGDARVTGVEGYHDADAGGPFAYVLHGFEPAGQLLEDPTLAGACLLAIVTHELVEMLVDARADRYRRAPFRGRGGKLYGYVADEPCDPVQESAIAIHLPDGTRCDVSNWVLPAWYRPGAAGPYDALGLLKAPLTLLPGGYVIAAEMGGEDQSLFGISVHMDEPMAPWREQMKRANCWSRTRRRSE